MNAGGRKLPSDWGGSYCGMHNRDSCRNASQAGNIVYSAGEGLLPACGFMCPRLPA